MKVGCEFSLLLISLHDTLIDIGGIHVSRYRVPVLVSLEIIGTECLNAVVQDK